MVARLRGRTYEEKLGLTMTTLQDRRVRGDMIQTFKILNHVDRVRGTEKELLIPGTAWTLPS